MGGAREGGRFRFRNDRGDAQNDPNHSLQVNARRVMGRKGWEREEEGGGEVKVLESEVRVVRRAGK